LTKWIVYSQQLEAVPVKLCYDEELFSILPFRFVTATQLFVTIFIAAVLLTFSWISAVC